MTSKDENMTPYDTRLGQHLFVHTHWARHHEWPRGETWNFPPLPTYVMWLVKRGVVDVRLDGKLFRVNAGEVCLYPHVEKRFITVCEDAEWLTLGLEATLYGSIDLLAPLTPALWCPTNSNMLCEWLEMLVETERASHWEDIIIHNSLSRVIVGWCWKELGGGLEQVAQELLSPWLRQVLEAMRRELHLGVSEHIANSGYSPAQFRRHFKQAMGCSPQEYLTRIRLEHARHLLMAASRPVSEVAGEAGFANLEHFTRQFKKAYGMTPSHFRQASKRPKM